MPYVQEHCCGEETSCFSAKVSLVSFILVPVNGVTQITWFTV